MDTKEFLEALTPVLVNALIVVVTYIFANIGNFAKQLFEEKWQKDLAEQTVKYVEQVFKGVGGEEKFNKAKEALIQKFNDKGIKFTDLDIEILIESAVNEFYSHWDDGGATTNEKAE